MKKIIIGTVIAGVLALSGQTLAQTSTTTATTTPAVTAYLAQIQILRQLQQGMSGDDVKVLQAYLASQPDIYPEGLMTGFYGPLTSKAVAKLQKKLGIDAVGRVGPVTLKRLNKVMSDDAVATERTNGTTTVCAKIPPGHLIAPGFLKKNGGKAPAIPVCQVLPPGIAKKLGTTTATTTPTPTPTATPTPTPTPTPAPAPIISSLVATTTATTSKVSWTTNVWSAGKLWFGTSTPVNTATGTVTSTSVSGLAHEVNLSGLSTSTLYYYIVSATNSTGVAATSSQQSFSTLAQ